MATYYGRTEARNGGYALELANGGAGDNFIYAGGTVQSIQASLNGGPWAVVGKRTSSGLAYYAGSTVCGSNPALGLRYAYGTSVKLTFFLPEGKAHVAGQTYTVGIGIEYYAGDDDYQAGQYLHWGHPTPSMALVDGPMAEEQPLLSAPATATATPDGDHIDVSWSAVENAATYRIQRKVTNGTYADLATVSAPTTSYVDSTAVVGTTYTYQVRAEASGYTASAYKATSTATLTTEIASVAFVGKRQILVTMTVAPVTAAAQNTANWSLFPAAGYVSIAQVQPDPRVVKLFLSSDMAANTEYTVTVGNGVTGAGNKTGTFTTIPVTLISCVGGEQGEVAVEAFSPWAVPVLCRSTEVGGTYFEIDQSLLTFSGAEPNYTLIDPRPQRGGVAIGGTAYYKFRVPIGGTDYYSAVASAVSDIDYAAIESDIFAALHGYLATQTGGYVDNVFPAAGQFYSFVWCATMAYAYQQTGNPAYLTDVSNQWEHEKTLVDEHHLWENDGWTVSHRSIDHHGRFIWYILMAANLLRQAGETTISAEMYQYVDDGAQAVIALFKQPNDLLYWHLDEDYAGFDAADVPNQVCWPAAALAKLRFMRTSVLYGSTVVDDIVKAVIDYTHTWQQPDGEVRDREYGYHSVVMLTLSFIQHAYGKGWYAILDHTLSAGLTYTQTVDGIASEPYFESPNCVGYDEFSYEQAGITPPLKSIHYTRLMAYPANRVMYSERGDVWIGPWYEESGLTGGGTIYQRSQEQLDGPMMTQALASVPEAPGNVVGVHSGSSVTVTFDDNSTNESGIKWKRSVNGGAYGSVTTVATPDATSFIDSSLPAEWETLTYAVAAYNDKGSSAWVESNVLTTPPIVQAASSAFRFTDPFSVSLF